MGVCKVCCNTYCAEVFLWKWPWPETIKNHCKDRADEHTYVQMFYYLSISFAGVHCSNVRVKTMKCNNHNDTKIVFILYIFLWILRFTTALWNEALCFGHNWSVHLLHLFKENPLSWRCQTVPWKISMHHSFISACELCDSTSPRVSAHVSIIHS